MGCEFEIKYNAKHLKQEKYRNVFGKAGFGKYSEELKVTCSAFLNKLG